MTILHPTIRGTPINDPDQALALRARDDRAAFGQLYDRYLAPVHGYCYRRLGNREAAEDATAIIFMKALTGIASFRANGPSFRAWLFTIAHHTVVDQVRHARARDRALDRVHRDDDTTSPGPEAAAIVAADVARVRSLLATLSPDQARMIELRLAGLNDREIGHVMGRSHGSVRVAIHRALVQLRHQLQIEEDRDA